MVIKIHSLLFFLFLNFLFSYAQDETTIVVESKGVYADIDISRDKLVMELLKDSSNANLFLDSVLSSPESYTPVLLYIASNVLFTIGDKDSAAFWFYTGQLRARIDANLCLDESAGNAVSVLNHNFGYMINAYTFQNPEKLAKTIKSVAKYVRNHDENYDRRWIATQGMQAMIESLEGSDSNKNIIEPYDKWAEIKEETVSNYETSFLNALIELIEEDEYEHEVEDD